jgi:hypothetical protein
VANAAAAGLAGVAAPLFYLVRWTALRREYDFEFTFFTELATNGPTTSTRGPRPQQAAEERIDRTDTQRELGETDWIAVLGLSESATVHDVKQAYKILIRQNHPDRVQDMSPALRTLAETETKRINAAYHQALLSVAS